MNVACGSTRCATRASSSARRPAGHVTDFVDYSRAVTRALFLAVKASGTGCHDWPIPRPGGCVAAFVYNGAPADSTPSCTTDGARQRSSLLIPLGRREISYRVVTVTTKTTTVGLLRILLHRNDAPRVNRHARRAARRDFADACGSGHDPGPVNCKLAPPAR